MNYLIIINNFWSVYRRNPISEKAVALFFALLQIANNDLWKFPLLLTNQYIRGFVNMSERNFYRAREELVSRGYIMYTPVGRKSGCKYFLCISDSKDNKKLLQYYAGYFGCEAGSSGGDCVSSVVSDCVNGVVSDCVSDCVSKPESDNVSQSAVSSYIITNKNTDIDIDLNKIKNKNKNGFHNEEEGEMINNSSKRSESGVKQRDPELEELWKKIFGAKKVWSSGFDEEGIMENEKEELL